MTRELLLILFVLVVAIATAYWVCRDTDVAGGARRVILKHIFESPKKVEYTDDMTGEKRMHDTKMDRYKAPETKSQIRQIVRAGGAQDYGRLVALIGKFYRRPARDVAKLLDKPDDAIYAAMPRREPVDLTRRDRAQAEGIWRVLRRHVDGAVTMLDVGCNRGGITRELGKLAGAKRIMGVDIIDESDSGIEYIRLGDDAKLPQLDSSVDLVTANMTLHHIRDVERMVSEIVRVLKPGGILFIKEHDCWDAIDAMLIDVEHMIYGDIGSDPGQYGIFRYTNYSGWDTLLQPLKYVDADYYYPGIKNDITPTRAFWAVYKKMV